MHRVSSPPFAIRVFGTAMAMRKAAHCCCYPMTLKAKGRQLVILTAPASIWLCFWEQQIKSMRSPWVDLTLVFCINDISLPPKTWDWMCQDQMQHLLHSPPPRQKIKTTKMGSLHTPSHTPFSALPHSHPLLQGPFLAQLGKSRKSQQCPRPSRSNSLTVIFKMQTCCYKTQTHTRYHAKDFLQQWEKETVQILVRDIIGPGAWPVPFPYLLCLPFFSVPLVMPEHTHVSPEHTHIMSHRNISPTHNIPQWSLAGLAFPGAMGAWGKGKTPRVANKGSG